MFVEREELAGVESRRLGRARKSFELLLEQMLGAQVRVDGAAAMDLWSALTGVVWRGPDGEQVQFSDRGAADLVAWIREDEDATVFTRQGRRVSWPLGSVLNWRLEVGQAP